MSAPLPIRASTSLYDATSRSPFRHTWPIIDVLAINAEVKQMPL